MTVLTVAAIADVIGLIGIGLLAGRKLGKMETAQEAHATEMHGVKVVVLAIAQHVAARDGVELDLGGLAE